MRDEGHYVSCSAGTEQLTVVEGGYPVKEGSAFTAVAAGASSGVTVIPAISTAGTVAGAAVGAAVVGAAVVGAAVVGAAAVGGAVVGAAVSGAAVVVGLSGTTCTTGMSTG